MINPDPLHAVHSYGFRRVSPRTPSSFRSRFVTTAGVARRPVPSQNAHDSPPVDAHAAHGAGSPRAPRTRAVSPSAATVPATETSCVVSYGFEAGSTARGTRADAREDVVGVDGRARGAVVARRARMTDALMWGRCVRRDVTATRRRDDVGDDDVDVDAFGCARADGDAFWFLARARDAAATARARSHEG